MDGGGAIKGFGLDLIDHGLKDGDPLWFQEALIFLGVFRQFRKLKDCTMLLNALVYCPCAFPGTTWTM